MQKARPSAGSMGLNDGRRSELDYAGRKEQKSNMIVRHPGTGGISAARANLTRAEIRCALPGAKHG